MMIGEGLLARNRAPGMRSALHLPSGLVDLQLHRERLFPAAVMGPSHRRGAETVEPHSDPHVGVRCANPVRGIEGDPP